MKIENNANIDLTKIYNPKDTTATNSLTQNPEANNFERVFKKAMDGNDEVQLRKSCSEFESIFVKIVYKEMKSSVMKSNLLPESNAREMFDSLLDDKLTEESSKAGGIGLGDMLFKSMKKAMVNKYKL